MNNRTNNESVHYVNHDCLLDDIVVHTVIVVSGIDGDIFLLSLGLTVITFE